MVHYCATYNGAIGCKIVLVHHHYYYGIINPRRACVERVTVVVLCICLSVCLLPL
jgi:hypothetical protein